MIFKVLILLIFCKDMELYEVLSMPFKLVRFNLFHDPLQIKAKFKTNDIFGETTKEEIFILSKMYLDHIILQVDRKCRFCAIPFSCVPKIVRSPISPIPPISPSVSNFRVTPSFQIMNFGFPENLPSPLNYPPPFLSE